MKSEVRAWFADAEFGGNFTCRQSFLSFVADFARGCVLRWPFSSLLIKWRSSEFGSSRSTEGWVNVVALSFKFCSILELIQITRRQDALWHYILFENGKEYICPALDAPFEAV